VPESQSPTQILLLLGVAIGEPKLNTEWSIKITHANGSFTGIGPGIQFKTVAITPP
jgi:hypothetical protein